MSAFRYKVTNEDGSSFVVEGKYARTYKPGATVSADPSLLALGYGLLVFRYGEDAIEFARWEGKPFLLFKVEVNSKDRMPLPNKLMLHGEHAFINIRHIKAIASKPPIQGKHPLEVPPLWPEGTEMYPTITVIQEVTE